VGLAEGVAQTVAWFGAVGQRRLTSPGAAT
jgi:hypothetical protein